MKRRIGIVCGGLALVAGFAALAQAQAGRGASTGVYSKAQAERGAALYATDCAACHGAAMEGLDVAPSLVGARFTGTWVGQPVAALATRIRTTMPLDRPGILGQAASAELTAGILAANGFPAGEADLPASPSQLQQFVIDPPPAPP